MLIRFETEEIKDSWARRQLVDTQMVSNFRLGNFAAVEHQLENRIAIFRLRIYGDRIVI